MRKKVMKQVIKRQRVQIENLTKALAAMSTLNKKSSTTEIPVRTVPYINGTRLDPRLNTRLTPPGLADSIKEAEKENREFVEVPASVYGDPSLYPDEMKTFGFRTVKADSKHDDVLDGAARMYVEAKAERKGAILKDIDDTSMYPSRMKSFDMKPSKESQDFFKKLTSAKKETSSSKAQTDETTSVVKSIYPKINEDRDGDYHRDLAKDCLDNDDYVYRCDWRDLLDTAERANLPITLTGDACARRAARLQSGSDLDALIMARAVIEKSSAIRATIWLIEAMRFLNEQCSDGKYEYGSVNDEPAHGMLVSAFKTASSDLRQIITEAALDKYNEADKESKEEN